MAPRNPSRIVVGASDYDIQLALGQLITNGRNGLQAIDKFGANIAVGTTFEGVWYNGGLFNFPTAAETVRIKVGGNPNDTAAGIGAKLVTVFGIDEGFNLAEETLMTAGALASASSTTKFWRVFRARVVEVGTYGGSNSGDIIIENTISTQILANIEALQSSTNLAMYSTPINHTALIRNISVTVEATKTTTIEIRRRENFDIVVAPFGPDTLVRRFVGLENFHPQPFKSHIILPERSDLWMNAKTDIGTAAVTVAFDMVLVPNA